MTLDEIYAIPANRDGWRVLPNGNCLHIGTGVTSEIDLAKIGNWAMIASYAVIGSYAEIGNYAEIGDHAEIGNHADIGSYAVIGNYAEIGNYADIGSYAKIGNSAKIRKCAKIGNYVVIGSGAKIAAKQVLLKTPLAVQGSKHLAGNYRPGMIQIGCELYSFEHWKQHALAIAREYGYTAEEGLEYQKIIDFLIANGVPADAGASERAKERHAE